MSVKFPRGGSKPILSHPSISLVLVQPRKTRPCLTERLLMGLKESNQKPFTKYHKLYLCKMFYAFWALICQFKPNGISCSHQLDQSISVLRFLGGIFSFLFKFLVLCKQTVETLIRRCVLQRLIWVCTVCLCPTKGP